MRVVAINCGSSTVKAALVDTASRSVGEAFQRELTSGATFESTVTALLDEVAKRSEKSIEAVAHRLVHGGERFVEPLVLGASNIAQLEELSVLAPAHNPPALVALRLARERWPDLPHIAVFDTAFHSTLPRLAREYALPGELTTRHGIRRYGFHGSNHAYVVTAVAEHLHANPAQLRIISCHLGNGASVAAIQYGRSVDTSMGMTPLEGLVMGSRAGDVDPGVILHLLRRGGMDVATLDEVLNAQSGLVGLTGTNDMREIERRAAAGDQRCARAIDLYAYRVRKYIGAYAAVMGGVDAIVFTGGIGENSSTVRARCLERLEFLGAVIDADANRTIRVTPGNPIASIAALHTRAAILVVRANEELTIACDAGRRLRAGEPANERVRIPVAVSARHAHLSQPTIDVLFGPGHKLTVRGPLSQTGQYSAAETISLIGPSGRIDGVRVLGPPRDRDQVEISSTDEFALGIQAPLRLSGDLDATPGVTVEGTRGRLALPSGVINARRHVHMSPKDAAKLGVAHGDMVDVRVDSEGRDLVFSDVSVRVSDDFRLEMHIDTDEANAAGIGRGSATEPVEWVEVVGVVRRSDRARHGT
jgi:acetate kinase